MKTQGFRVVRNFVVAGVVSFIMLAIAGLTGNQVAQYLGMKPLGIITDIALGVLTVMVLYLICLLCYGTGIMIASYGDEDDSHS